MNMKRILYHGSKDIIEKPTYGKGKRYNDYGRGFYCTENLSLAMEWAVDRQRDGFANVYELEDDGLSVLHLNAKEYCILHWLAILLENRTFDALSPLAEEAKEYLLDTFHLPYRDYDVIIGYRADDSYFSFAEDFLNGVISYRQLTNAMRLGKLGEQVVLMRKTAFDRIHYLESKPVSYREWFPKKEKRDKIARRDYFDLEKNRRMKGDIYIQQIMDEEMKPDDARLR